MILWVTDDSISAVKGKICLLQGLLTCLTSTYQPLDKVQFMRGTTGTKHWNLGLLLGECPEKVSLDNRFYFGSISLIFLIAQLLSSNIR